MEDKDIASNILKKAFVSAYFTVCRYKRHRHKLYTWMQHMALRSTLEPLRAMNQWPTVDQIKVIKTNLLAVLHSMDEKYQAVIHLTYSVGLSRRQTAMQLNIPLRQVEDLLQAALFKLQDYLNNYSWHDCKPNKD